MKGVSDFWLVTVPLTPRETSNREAELNKFRRAVQSAKSDYVINLKEIDLPEMKVVSLDSLIALSDDLSKIDSNIENLMKRIARQYCDLELGHGNSNTSSSVAASLSALKVNKLDVNQYINNFFWLQQQYPQTRSLPELVSLIVQSSTKIEEELKTMYMQYSEKEQAIQTLDRKKGGPLTTIDLNEIIKEEHVQGAEFVNTDHLITLVVVVPKTLEDEWNTHYEILGEDIAGFSSPDWTTQEENIGNPASEQHGTGIDRCARRGSPVVPGSSVKIFEDRDACLYTVTILKGQYEAGFYEEDPYTGDKTFQKGAYTDYVQQFVQKCKDNRFTVRQFCFNPDAATNILRAENSARKEVQKLNTQLLQWCKTQYSTVVVGWMHLKAIRTFVEAVLKYGLPPFYLTVICEVDKRKNDQFFTALKKVYDDTDTMQFLTAKDDKEKEEEEYCSFVYDTFNPQD